MWISHANLGRKLLILMSGNLAYKITLKVIVRIIIMNLQVIKALANTFNVLIRNGLIALIFINCYLGQGTN